MCVRSYDGGGAGLGSKNVNFCIFGFWNSSNVIVLKTQPENYTTRDENF